LKTSEEDTMLHARFNSHRRNAARLSVIACTAFVCTAAVHAQQYPSKPVRIVVGYPPGGAVDILARVLAQQLGQGLGQQFIVENRGGASGIIGADIISKSPADGYSLLVLSGAHAVNPSLYKKLPYDTERDFAPISLIASSAYIMVVHPSLPVKSVRELIAFAKAHRGEINYASSGNAGMPHLSGELFKVKAGIEMTHIPYKGSAAVTTAVLAGEVPIMFSNLISTMPQVHAGRFRALGVTGLTRLPAAPDIPTIAEAGLPGFEVVGWYGFMAPAGTPAEIIARLSAQTVKAMQSPEVLKRFASEGIDPVGSTPDAFGKVIRDDIVKWADVVRVSGAKVD
jgi:tripartite-type tricarboxylate transporter receptor subunit TctC